jgi:hypothetical protein
MQVGDVFFLNGELGAGKTSLARGFLRVCLSRLLYSIRRVQSLRFAQAFFQNPLLDVPSPSYLLSFTYGASASTSSHNEAAVGEPGAASSSSAAKGRNLYDGCENARLAGPPSCFGPVLCVRIGAAWILAVHRSSGPPFGPV